MSKTKIIIIQLKEIIYTAIFVGLGILLILLLIFMFFPKKDIQTSRLQPNEKKYTAGVYNSMITLNNTALNLEVIVDENTIHSVRIVNVDQSITTMFPLLAPSLKQLEKQLCNGTDIDHIKLSKQSKYTQTLLLDAIRSTLQKAEKH